MSEIYTKNSKILAKIIKDERFLLKFLFQPNPTKNKVSAKHFKKPYHF
jgi:hypothetical protein